MKKQILLSILASFLCVAILPAQYTSIPDKGFETWLIEQGIDTEGHLDGRVLTKDIDGIKELEIDDDHPVSDTIYSLMGIEGFKALRFLSVDASKEKGKIKIDSLDLSSNTRLSYLYLSNFDLKFLDISKKIFLGKIILKNIKIKSLDLSGCKQLQELIIQKTLLDSLDLSYGINDYSLLGLNLEENGLKYLNLNNIQWVFSRYGGITVRNNPDLHCIYVANSNIKEMEQRYKAIDSTAHLVKSEAECDSVTAVRLPEIREEMHISPNPTQEQVDVTLPSRGSGYDRLSLYDYRGHRVMTIPVDPHRTDYRISLRDVPEGLYLLVATGLSGKEKTLARKLVKY